MIFTNLCTAVSARRRLTQLTLIFAALFMIPVVGFTGTAAAITYNCPSNTLCVYTGKDGTGTRFTWGGSWSGCTVLPPSINNQTSSIQNNMPGMVIFSE